MFSKPLLKVNENLQFESRFATMPASNWTTDMHGRSLELFFIDGRPDGMLTAEIFGWTGHILFAPRTQIGEALKRKQAHFTGIYILMGDTEDGHQVYIGETDSISDRIKNHDSKKVWWTEAIMITSAANILNKAHVKYIESALIGIALEIGHSTLENGNEPNLPSLSEADVAKMEAYLENILLVLPALGVETFLQKSRPKSPARGTKPVDVAEPHFVITSAKHKIKAQATIRDGEFIVLAGSNWRNGWANHKDHNYYKLFAKLAENGILMVNDNALEFSEDFAFSSPSAAAAMVFGRPSNGLTAWKLRGTKKTYRDWEAETLSDT